MSEPRLPDLLTAMREAITEGDLTRCLQLQEKLENEWGAIAERLEYISGRCLSSSIAMDDLMEGVW